MPRLQVHVALDREIREDHLPGMQDPGAHPGNVAP
jgi:hypothetical protein